MFNPREIPPPDKLIKMAIRASLSSIVGAANYNKPTTVFKVLDEFFNNLVNNDSFKNTGLKEYAGFLKDHNQQFQKDFFDKAISKRDFLDNVQQFMDLQANQFLPRGIERDNVTIKLRDYHYEQPETLANVGKFLLAEFYCKAVYQTREDNVLSTSDIEHIFSTSALKNDKSTFVPGKQHIVSAETREALKNALYSIKNIGLTSEQDRNQYD